MKKILVFIILFIPWLFSLLFLFSLKKSILIYNIFTFIFYILFTFYIYKKIENNKFNNSFILIFILYYKLWF